jgi:hypothetical protein
MTHNRKTTTKPPKSRTRNRVRSKGTAMVESLLALPFIMLILLFIMYFGRNSTRIQRVRVMDRYEAWQTAGHGPGPSVNHHRGHSHMNDTFFEHTAASIGHSGNNGFPDDARDRWVQEVGSIHDQAGELAQAMHDNMASGTTAHFSTSFAHSNKLLKRFAGSIKHTHTVQDHDWKFVNGFGRGGGPWDQRGPGANNLDSLRDVFYDDWDNTLDGMGDSGNGMADMLRSLYLSSPGYRGPEVN